MTQGAPTRLLLATNSAHKVAELAEIFRDLPVQLITPRDLSIDLEVDETGVTFVENAILKAEAFARASGLPALADDSGLEVDALGGQPGVHSRRYAGPDVTDSDRIQLLLRNLREVPASSRTARFRCVMALASPVTPGPDCSTREEPGSDPQAPPADRSRCQEAPTARPAHQGISAAPSRGQVALIGTVDGTCEGRIAFAPWGEGGFGYDPVFLLPERGLTMAQLTAAEKNTVSHRGRAGAAASRLVLDWLRSAPASATPAGRAGDAAVVAPKAGAGSASGAAPGAGGAATSPVSAARRTPERS